MRRGLTPIHCPTTALSKALIRSTIREGDRVPVRVEGDQLVVQEVHPEEAVA